MPLFNVHFTYTAFKRLPDDSQQKVERSLGGRMNIVADSANAAIAIAARDIKIESADDETLSTATVTVVKQG